MVELPPPGWFLMSAPGVKAWPLPYFEGPWEFLVKWLAIRESILHALTAPHAVILRAPHHVSDLVLQIISKPRPFGVEIVGDPETALASGNIRTILREVARRYLIFRQKLLCSRACAVAYVTKNALQQRYPASEGVFTTHYSSVELTENTIVSNPRVPQGPLFRLFHAGSMSTYYKGQDVLLQAVKLLLDKSWKIELCLAGDGPIRADLERMANSLGISEQVRFLGLLPGPSAVQQELDRADLFVFPSRSEGLPRILIEAMARGLPCIASRVGGIPELLASEDTIAEVKPTLLAEKIQETLSDPSQLLTMSMRNLDTVKEYTVHKLDERRHRFYEEVKRKTDDWLKQ